MMDKMIKMAESLSCSENGINNEYEDKPNKNRTSGKLKFTGDFTQIFRAYVENSPEFEDALNIARKNSTGKIWTIGSFVYRNIIKRIYRRKLRKISEIDMDFLVEYEPEGRMYIPRGWELRMTSYLNPYFLQKEKKIRVDLNFLSNMRSILTRNLEPTLENFLTGTPLTIQSLAYDSDEETIIGDIGMKAISEKKVKINNLGEAKFEADKREISLGELVKQKADKLRFNYILP